MTFNPVCTNPYPYSNLIFQDFQWGKERAYSILSLIFAVITLRKIGHQPMPIKAKSPPPRTFTPKPRF